MGKDVPDGAGQRAPIGREGGIGIGGGGCDLSVAPFAGRHFHHAAEKPLGGALAQHDGAVWTHRPIGEAAPGRPYRLRRAARQVFRQSLFEGDARRAQRTTPAGGLLRPAHTRAQIHQSLRVIAGPDAGRQFRRQRTDALPRRRQCFGDAEQPGDDPFHIAIHHRRRPVEGDGGDGGGGVGADAGKCLEFLCGFGEVSGEVSAYRLGASLQVAGAGVIAKPLPGVQHIVEACLGERADVRPTHREGSEIGDHRGDGGLLQHDLGEPDAVGIGAPAPPWRRAEAPRQRPSVGAVPIKHAPGNLRARRPRRRHGGKI